METIKPCDFCIEYCQGDRLYDSSSWDGGIGFDYVEPINFCPLCGKKLKTEDEWKHFYDREE